MNCYSKTIFLCPNECQSVPIGQRRKAGCPRLAVRAYLRQSISRLQTTLFLSGGLLLIDHIAETDHDEDSQDQEQDDVLITAT